MSNALARREPPSRATRRITEQAVAPTLDELAERTGQRASLLSVVLHEEQAAGRVRLVDGRYRLVREALEPQLLTALRRIEL